jgi:hypothetical protein
VSLSEIVSLEIDIEIDIDGNALVGASTNVKLGAMGDSLIDTSILIKVSATPGIGTK